MRTPRETRPYPLGAAASSGEPMAPDRARRAPPSSWLDGTAVALSALRTRAAGVDPPEFITQTPDVGGVTGDVGLFAPIRLDGGVNPWVSDDDDANGNLKCAHKSAGV